MSAQQIRTLLLAKAGRLKAVANELDITQQALSRTINYHAPLYAVRKKLEARYDVRFIPVTQLQPRESSTAANVGRG